MAESGPMSCKDDSVLDIYRSLLYDKLKPMHLLPFLATFLPKECLVTVRRADKRSSAEAVDVLIDGLRERNEPGWFQGFRDALRQAEFDYLSQLLEGTSSVPQAAEEYYSQLITLFYPDLKRIDPLAVCRILLEHKCISQQDGEEIRATQRTEGDTSAAMLLLTNIANRRHDWFPMLIHALKGSGFQDIAAKISEHFEDAESYESIKARAELLVEVHGGDMSEDEILAAKRKAQRKFLHRDGCREEKRLAHGQEEKRLAHAGPEGKHLAHNRKHDVLDEGAARISGKDDDITLVKQRTQAQANDLSRTKRKTHQHDFSVFNTPDAADRPRISPQLTLATFQYLSTSVPPFKPELISENVLQKLLKQNVIEQITIKDPNSPNCYIYQRGKAADYFVLILQGRAEVEIGRDSMTFEAGPFMHFGLQSLTGLVSNLSKHHSLSSISSASDSIYAKQASYVPDFSLKALESTQYLKIARSHYIAARRATLMERQPKTPDSVGEDVFSTELKRAISATADTDSTTTSPAAGRRSHGLTTDVTEPITATNHRLHGASHH